METYPFLVTVGCAQRHITVFIRFFERVEPPGPNVYRVAGDKVNWRDGFWLQIGVRDTGECLAYDTVCIAAECSQGPAYHWMT